MAGRTRPIPHHFSGTWGPPQIDDLEECFTSLEQDAATLDAAIDALASGQQGPVGPMGPPGMDGADAEGAGSDGGFWPIVDQRPRVTAAQVLARVFLGT